MPTISYDESKQIAHDIVKNYPYLFRSIITFCEDVEKDYMDTHKFKSPYEVEATSSFGDTLLDVLENRTAFARELQEIDDNFIEPVIGDDEDYGSIWNDIYTEVLLMR